MADTALAPPIKEGGLPMDGAPKAALGFEAAYDAYGPMVYRLAMVYLGCRADAEDVTQEAAPAPPRPRLCGRGAREAVAAAGGGKPVPGSAPGLLAQAGGGAGARPPCPKPGKPGAGGGHRGPARAV